MSFDISELTDIVTLFWHGVRDSMSFLFLTTFLKVYTFVVLFDLILLIYMHDIRANLQVQRFGSRRPLVSPSKFRKRWDAVKARLRSGNPSYYKAAILEADTLADDMLGEIGFEGGNIGERLDLVMPGQILSAERLLEAHRVRNRIIRDPDFDLPKGESEEILAFYEAFFKELELI
jgi:hypothetical protein